MTAPKAVPSANPSYCECGGQLIWLGLGQGHQCDKCGGRTMQLARGVRYEVWVWCEDCAGDELGCFDGVKIPLTGPDNETHVSFETRELATLAGEKFTERQPWKFEIKEV